MALSSSPPKERLTYGLLVSRLRTIAILSLTWTQQVRVAPLKLELGGFCDGWRCGGWRAGAPQRMMVLTLLPL